MVNLQNLKVMQKRNAPFTNEWKRCYLEIEAKRGIRVDCDEHPTTNQHLERYDYKSRYAPRII